MTEDDNMLGAKPHNDDGFCVESVVQQYISGLEGVCAQRSIRIFPVYQGQHWAASSATSIYQDLNVFFSEWFQRAEWHREYRLHVGHEGNVGYILLQGSQQDAVCQFPLKAYHATPLTEYAGMQIAKYNLSALAAPGEGRSPRGSVLIVDASREICEFWRWVLQCHYLVHCATDRRDVVGHLQDPTVIGVLADPQLKEGCILDLLHQSGKSWIACSTLLEPDFDLTCLQHGAIAFYGKPFCARSVTLSLRQLCTSLSTEGVGRRTSRRDLRSFILEQIESNLSNVEFDVRSLSNLCHIDARTLQRKCLVFFNQSPSMLLRQRRLMRAAACLSRGDSVASAAHACGFAHSEAFSRAFKHHFACCPSQFRERSNSDVAQVIG